MPQDIIKNIMKQMVSEIYIFSSYSCNLSIVYKRRTGSATPSSQSHCGEVSSRGEHSFQRHGARGQEPRIQ